MGTIIRKGAAVADILDDAETTLRRARDKETNDWKLPAEERLPATLALTSNIQTRLTAANAEYTRLKEIVDREDVSSDHLVGGVSDDVWNAIGRPAQDPMMSLLFPGGIMIYTKGPDDEQPQRMTLLAELLEANIHPRLPADQGKALGQKLRDAAATYQLALDDLKPVQIRIALLEKMLGALARVAQVDLVNLKRIYKTKGFTESEIHQIIPDRP